MAISAAEQAAAVVEYEQWREERITNFADTSAAAYGTWLREQEDLAKLEQIRLHVGHEPAIPPADAYESIKRILYPEGTA